MNPREKKIKRGHGSVFHISEKKHHAEYGIDLLSAAAFTATN